MSSCDACLQRRWLLERLAPHLERQRAEIMELQAIRDDLELIDAVAGGDRDEIRAEYERRGPEDCEALIEQAAAAGLELVCRDGDRYPPNLARSASAPAVLSVNGDSGRLADLCAGEAVAIVGTRKPTRYGLAAATAMARELSAAGVAIVSGMAFGIDSAAHEGALEGGGRTIAVLPGAANRPYPAAKMRLFNRIAESGVVLSELGQTARVWRWALQARNRVIAGLADVTVLIEGPERSGAMITVREAGKLGDRWVTALPGPVGVSQSAGPNRVLAKHMAGAQELTGSLVRGVRDAQDVLDLLYGEGIVDAPRVSVKPAPTAAEAQLLARIDNGMNNVTMLSALDLATLTALELKGWVTRGAGGGLVALHT